MPEVRRQVINVVEQPLIVDLGVPRSSRGVGTTRGPCFVDPECRSGSTIRAGSQGVIGAPEVEPGSGRALRNVSFPGQERRSDLPLRTRANGRRTMGRTIKHLKSLPGWPLMLSDEQAAAYTGLSDED